MAYQVWKVLNSNPLSSQLQDIGEEDEQEILEKVIKQPMDLKMIKDRIDCGEISSAKELWRDTLLMFSNALICYSLDSEVRVKLYLKKGGKLCFDLFTVIVIIILSSLPLLKNRSSES